MITQTFNLNLIPKPEPIVIHVDQYDTGTGRFIINLYDGDVLYSPNGIASIQGTKPDGKGFRYDAILSGNTVTANVTEQMTAVSGDVRTQIVITESTGRTGTFAFIMRVQKSALPDDTSLSETDIPIIEQGIEAALDSEAWAVGKRGGEDVPSTDPTYHNNSKYYAEVSDDNSEDSEAWAVGTRNGVPVSQTDPQYENNAKYWAEHTEVSDMTNSVKGIGKPDTVTAEAANGIFSAIGTTIVATIDPNATPFSATWLKYNNETIVPDSRKQYRVTYSGETGLWYWNGSAYEKLAGGGGGGGGHTILDSAGYPVTARANLRFDLMEVDDDPQNNATVVHSPIVEVPDQATWESMTPDPNQAYFLPWMQTEDMKADKSDLASISITGTTNNTGSSIASGTYFYLNGTLVQATAAIASGATLTSGTNYSVVTAGGLNKLRSEISALKPKRKTATITSNQWSVIYFPSGVTVLDAYLTNNQNSSLLLYTEDSLKYRSAVYTDWSVGTGTSTRFTANTAYSITYTYIDAGPTTVS